MVELLSPVGDFECLKAAVQNGANSVYFGGQLFNARENATNFGDENLKEAIQYAKLRNVKVDFTINTLIKDDEFNSAIELTKKIYKYGADAVIVQDLGLAKFIIDNFPGLHVHASTQMTIHNLHGALECEKLGFKRVVLSRELSLRDIEYICKNTNIEIETFVHGALCICYSGQCLLSSSIGARSGNRGKCAQPCRLPYKLYENDKKIDESYLLSTRDLCSLEFLPDLIKAGVKCFKIEGRMKTPEYVATCTRIYRKYIDLAIRDPENYKIDEDDVKKLMQVFNRGGFSTGNLKSSANLDYVYKEKPNNMGLYIGNVSNFDSKKGLVTFRTNEKLHIGDKISFQKEEHKYTISELMNKNKNIIEALPEKIVTIGRMKGNISLGDRIYKLSDKLETRKTKEINDNENIKIPLVAYIKIKENEPIELEVTSKDTSYGVYFSMSSKKISDTIPVKAISIPITEKRVKEQLNKTKNEIFEFQEIFADIDGNVFVPKISVINELRREVIADLKEQATKRIERNNELKFDGDTTIKAIKEGGGSTTTFKELQEYEANRDATLNNTKKTENLADNENIKSQEEMGRANCVENNDKIKISLKSEDVKSTKEEIESAKKELNKPHISILLNEVNLKYNYSKMEKVDKVYVPLKYFLDKNYKETLKTLETTGKLYIYLQTILKDNFRNVFFHEIDQIIENYKIKGLVLSNLSCINYFKDYIGKLELVANYTYNIFNHYTIDELKKIGIDTVTVSPELDEEALKKLCKNSSLKTELIVYGKLPVMTTGYCLLGKANKCYPKCEAKCKKDNARFYLKDRLNMTYQIKIDNTQTITTIYNNRTTSINYSNIMPDSIRISILDENIDEINNIIKNVKNDTTFSGDEYTKFNLNKFV